MEKISGALKVGLPR